jgi:hypothetical protein
MSDEMVIFDNEGQETDLIAGHDVMNGLNFVDPVNMPDLDAAEVGIDISPKYMTFSTVGESLRGFYIGCSTINKREKGEMKSVKVAVIQNKTGFFLNGGASMVDKLSKIPVGTAIQIAYNGEEKTSSGHDVKTYDIRLLNVNTSQRPALQSVQQQPTKVQPQDKTGAPMFNTPAELFAKIEKDFIICAEDIKARLKQEGFTSFTPSRSAAMYNVFLKSQPDEIPF